MSKSLCPDRAVRAPYKPRVPGSLKASVSELVMMCGGGIAGGEALGISQSQVHRYTDPAEPDSHMPVNRVMTLQRMAGRAPVTEFMAAEMGGVVLWLPRAAPDDVGRDVAEIGATASKLFSDYGEAMGSPESPGRVDAREAARMVADADRVMAALAHLRGDLMGIIDHEGGEGKQP